jgi:hypothetical protein
MKRKNKRRGVVSRQRGFQTPSYTSPYNGKRGCLCWDENTYSSECCDGTLRAQGIGRIRKV